jgi:hypothetical protein
VAIGDQELALYENEFELVDEKERVDDLRSQALPRRIIRLKTSRYMPKPCSKETRQRG